jgi:hypothetical protein
MIRAAELIGLLVVSGCTARNTSIADAFPPGSMATPWVLQGEVWSGSFDDAAPALGDDAATWGQFAPVRVWLAVYCHENAPERCLKVRCLAFATPEDAQQAATAFCTPGAAAFSYGDGGCWTQIGVLFRWGRLVLDIFGGDTSWGSEVQSAMLAAFFVKLMPAGLPGNPR